MSSDEWMAPRSGLGRMISLIETMCMVLVELISRLVHRYGLLCNIVMRSWIQYDCICAGSVARAACLRLAGLYNSHLELFMPSCLGLLEICPVTVWSTVQQEVAVVQPRTCERHGYITRHWLSNVSLSMEMVVASSDVPAHMVLERQCTVQCDAEYFQLFYSIDHVHRLTRYGDWWWQCVSAKSLSCAEQHYFWIEFKRSWWVQNQSCNPFEQSDKRSRAAPSAGQSFEQCRVAYRLSTCYSWWSSYQLIIQCAKRKR